MTSIIELARQAGLELNWFDDNFPVLPWLQRVLAWLRRTLRK